MTTASTRTPPSSSHWPKLGAKLGSYLLKDLLGQGGMGRVYLASRSSPQKDVVEEEVALKILDPGLAKRRMIRDFFLQEAELGKDLNHPNLVSFVDSGEVGGYLYLAFEYIHGVSLDKLIKKKGPFEVDLALSVLEDVAFGLASAHQKGIVHRDLKPQNVMITPDNVIKVIDFGLADADQGVGEGRTVGTPVYASPEQNLAKKTGPTADIYSLGLMTYEMFSGSRLLPGGGLQKVISQQVKLQKVLEKGIPLNPRIPKELRPLLRRMLEFKPGDRFANASELAATLERTIPAGKIKRSEVLERHKAAAVIELADTHYWKAMEEARQGNYAAASTQCRQLVALRPPTLLRLKGTLRADIVQLAWDPLLGGPVPEGEVPPVPDLKALEAIANMASAAELLTLKWFLQARLARLAKHYSKDYYKGLIDRCYDSVPVMLSLYRDPKSTTADRFLFTVPLTWSYLQIGCPDKAREVLEAGLEIDPENPALVFAREKIEAQLRDRRDGRDAIGALERVLETQDSDRDRVGKVVAFASNNPYLPEARELQISEARRAGMADVAADALLELGLREFFEEAPGIGLRRFVAAFRLQPTRSETVFFVMETLRHAGRTIHLPRDREARTEAMYQLVNHRRPLAKDLMTQLAARPGDRELLRELAALEAESAGAGRPEHYLIQLGAVELAGGDLAAGKAALEQAIGVARDAPTVLQQIRSMPGIEKVFSRLELARLSSEIGAG